MIWPLFWYIFGQGFKITRVPINVNFHLQNFLEIFEENSADKIWSNKDKGIKIPPPVPNRVNLQGHLWMTPPSNDGALGLSPKWGSARVSSLNFSRNKFKLGVAMGTVINRQDFLPITHSGITWFGLVTWKKKRKSAIKKSPKLAMVSCFKICSKLLWKKMF